jgi:hypothetical protein
MGLGVIMTPCRMLLEHCVLYSTVLLLARCAAEWQSVLYYERILYSE